MNTTDLYKRLETIFVDHTTNQWKNGWQHEGDRLSKELTIQKMVNCNNLFLLQKSSEGFQLEGPMGFEIEIEGEGDSTIRIDIEYDNIDLNIYYYVDNENDWIAHQDFIFDLCKNIYNANVLLLDSISVVPNNIYGDANPKFANKYSRERKLNELGINES